MSTLINLLTGLFMTAHVANVPSVEDSIDEIDFTSFEAEVFEFQSVATKATKTIKIYNEHNVLVAEVDSAPGAEGFEAEMTIRELLDNSDFLIEVNGTLIYRTK